MQTIIRNRPSPRLALYGVAFRVLRRVALSGEQRRMTMRTVAGEERAPRRVACPATSLEQAPSGGPAVRCAPLQPSPEP